MKLFICCVFMLVAVCCTASPPRQSRHKRSLILEYNWPEPDPSIHDFPHETACHYYYHVDSKQNMTIAKCPPGEIFDFTSHKCATREHAKCWSHHFNKKRHHGGDLHIIGDHHVKHFRCPFIWRKYSDTNDCSKFFMCLPNKAVHKTCPPEFPRFDKMDRKCVVEDYAVCADKTDIPEKDYTCPPTWGSFTYSKDCSKYYECFGKNPGLETCPRNTLFDETQRECLPKEGVHCGERHNPYEDLTKPPYQPSTHTSTAAQATSIAVSQTPTSDDQQSTKTDQSNEKNTKTSDVTISPAPIKDVTTGSTGTLDVSTGAGTTESGQNPN